MSEPTFDPGRKALARAVSEGLAEVRRKYPGASDEFTSEYLSGWLGHYVVAAQSQARLATIAAIRERVEGQVERVGRCVPDANRHICERHNELWIDDGCEDAPSQLLGVLALLDEEAIR